MDLERLEALIDSATVDLVEAKKLLNEQQIEVGDDVHLERSIWIDAGHGGHDPGCVHNEGRAEEKDLVMEVQDVLIERLSTQSVAGCTRIGDEFVTLSDRAEMANRADADYFVSLHINDAQNDAATGFEVFVAERASIASEDLADAILRQLQDKFTIPNRGLKKANFAVLIQTKMPAVLVEFGFMNGDWNTLSHPLWGENAADTIIKALKEVTGL